MPRWRVVFEREGELERDQHGRPTRILWEEPNGEGYAYSVHDAVSVEQIPEPFEPGWYRNSTTEMTYWLTKATPKGPGVRYDAYGDVYVYSISGSSLEYVGTLRWERDRELYTRLKLVEVSQ